MKEPWTNDTPEHNSFVWKCLAVCAFFATLLLLHFCCGCVYTLIHKRELWNSYENFRTLRAHTMPKEESEAGKEKQKTKESEEKQKTGQIKKSITNIAAIRKTIDEQLKKLQTGSTVDRKYEPVETKSQKETGKQDKQEKGESPEKQKAKA